jgi:PAS domain-containing protein
MPYDVFAAAGCLVANGVLSTTESTMSESQQAGRSVETPSGDAAAGRDEFRRAARLFRNATDAVFLANLNGRILEVNSEAERVYGWLRDDLIGQSIDVIVPENRHEQGEDLWNRCLRGESIRNV